MIQGSITTINVRPKEQKETGGVERRVTSRFKARNLATVEMQRGTTKLKVKMGRSGFATIEVKNGEKVTFFKQVL